MQPYLEDWGHQGFDVYFVSVDTAKNVQTFIDKNKLRLNVLLDETGSFFRAYAVSAIPLSVTVDQSGVVRYVDRGWGAGSLEQLKAKVAALCP